jgi:hypothetical protein
MIACGAGPMVCRYAVETFSSLFDLMTASRPKADMARAVTDVRF